MEIFSSDLNIHLDLLGTENTEALGDTSPPKESIQEIEAQESSQEIEGLRN